MLLPQVNQASETVRHNDQLQNLPVDRVLDLLSRALTAASAISDKAQAYDSEHRVTQKLFTSLETGIQNTYGAILKSREQVRM